MEKEAAVAAAEEEEEDPSKPPTSLAGEQWSLLPEFALHFIALGLSSPASFTSLCGVCRSWRSSISSSSIASDFISSIPPLILLFPRSTSSASASLYSLADDAIYDLPSNPSFQTLAFFGQSNGHLLAFNNSIPSIINPLSGSRLDFPSMLDPVFRFAILTESQLVLFKNESLLFCPMGGSQWTKHYFPAFKDAIFFQDRLYLTHPPDDTHVRVVEYDLEAKIKRQVFSGRRGLLVESSEGELLMVFKEQEMLVGIKLLPRTVKELGDNNRETDWPIGGERSLFLGWQRSDLSSSCLTGSVRRKYRIHSTSFFWRNYLALSQLRSNGFYVTVDAHGRAQVSKIQPAWLPFRQFL